MANTTKVVAEASKPAVQLSEGTRAELALRGYAISPFTGALLVGTGVDDVREVAEEEFKAVAKEASKRVPRERPVKL